MAEHARHHGLREVPRQAGHRAGGVPHAGLPRRPHRRLLPRVVAPLGLPLRHVPPHRAPLLLHRLRLRRHQQGGGEGRVREGVQGVQARGLLELAAEEGGELEELEQDQELPRRREGVQELAGERRARGAVLQRESISYSVRVLQASHRMRLGIRECDLLDRDAHHHHQLGLRDLEQRPGGALLRLPVLQGRRPRQPQERLEEGRRRQHRLPRLPRHRLLPRVLRLPEQQEG